MSNNKYYTPEKEEFHIGFEYEFRPRYRDGLFSMINQKFRYVEWWKKQTIGKEATNLIDALEEFGDPYNISDVMSYHKDGAVRVKHLDREDINSCGWSDKDHPYDWRLGKEFRMCYYDNNRTILCIEKGREGIFLGVIKNISELRRIMKMANIK